MKRVLAFVLSVAVFGALHPLVGSAGAQTDGTPAAIPARHVEPVVLTGAQLPGWSTLPAEGAGNPGTGHTSPVPGQEVRDAHNGRLVAPPAGPTAVSPDEIVAYRYDGTSFVEIPVQVDERFPYFLANSRSDFAHYSGTDKELTYAWDVESWKKMFGECFARYATDVAEVEAAIAAGWVMPASTSTPADLLAAKKDPVAALDHDDELVFMASDAGQQAPFGEGPPGTGDQRHEVALVDPRTGNVSFVYLFTRSEGSSFDATNGYVEYKRDDNADEWIDRGSFTNGHPENLGSSNTGYGPNIPGTVCNDPNGPTAPRASTDRFPRDGVTVSTDTYEWYGSGRWMVRDMRITKPGEQRAYGPDLIDRWKGRAFQQSPDSFISLVGFEDEQVNWEANSALLGERMGPVRAIRETWGADSGTNVTKTETFYRDSVNYRYRVRVHPIPPDGLYTSWDYNHDVAHTYYNETRSQGVPVDGINDEVVGNVDSLPTGQPAFFDAPDPTHTKPMANLNWEQVSGSGDSGSLVYMFENENPTSLENPLVVPYYRDDRCLDDGTGDDPLPRPFPGEASTDPRVYPEEHRTCTADSDETVWKNRQGCFACHGIHYFVTGDTDNATTSAGPVTEIDGSQWQWAVPTEQPTNVGDAYANTVKTPLVTSAVLEPNTAQPEPTGSPSVSPSETASESPTPTPAGPEETDLTFTETASTGQFSDEASFAARLTGEDGAPIAGAQLTFSLTSEEGTRTFPATTGADGIGRAGATLTERPGPAQLTVHYEGDEDRLGSSDTMGFEVAKEDSALSLQVNGNGNNRLLTATLVDADSDAGITTRTITFSADGTDICEGAPATDADGTTTCDPPPRHQAGPRDYAATFTEDDYYLGSTAQRST